MSYQQEAPTQEQPLTSKQAIAEAVDAAYLADGYIKDGERDHVAVADAIYPLVLAAQVRVPQERATKAVTRGSLIATVFPSLPKPTEWPGRPFAEEVDAAIRQKVWDLVKADRAGKVQELLGMRNPGLVLCRTKIGADRVDAVYVTDNLACIKEDFAGPLAETMRKANKRMSLNMAMAGIRLPEHSQTFDRLYRQASRRALNAGLEDTRLMLDAADGDDVDEDDGE